MYGVIINDIISLYEVNKKPKLKDVIKLISVEVGNNADTRYISSKNIAGQLQRQSPAMR